MSVFLISLASSLRVYSGCDESNQDRHRHSAPGSLSGDGDSRHCPQRGTHEGA